VNILDSIFYILILTLVSALVIWIVSKLSLGITVSGFGPAIVAAIVIAVLSWIITWLLIVLKIDTGGGWVGAIINLVISALILMLTGRRVKGLAVKGFVGAFVAAIAIAVLTWLIGLGLNLLM